MPCLYYQWQTCISGTLIQLWCIHSGITFPRIILHSNQWAKCYYRSFTPFVKLSANSLLQSASFTHSCGPYNGIENHLHESMFLFVCQSSYQVAGQAWFIFTGKWMIVSHWLSAAQRLARWRHNNPSEVTCRHAPLMVRRMQLAWFQYSNSLHRMPSLFRATKFNSTENVIMSTKMVNRSPLIFGGFYEMLVGRFFGKRHVTNL